MRGGERGRGPPGLGEVPGGGTTPPATKPQGPRTPGGDDLGPVICRAGGVAPGGGGDLGLEFDRSRNHVRCSGDTVVHLYRVVFLTSPP